jgi:hypothetical protein
LLGGPEVVVESVVLVVESVVEEALALEVGALAVSRLALSTLREGGWKTEWRAGESSLAGVAASERAPRKLSKVDLAEVPLPLCVDAGAVGSEGNILCT